MQYGRILNIFKV